MARFLIVALVGVWSHAAYQDCLAFMVADSPTTLAGESASPPCHSQEPGTDRQAPAEQNIGHDCLGVCDCGLQAVPVTSPTLHVASEFKPSVDDHSVAIISDTKRALQRTAFQSSHRHEQPAAACLHPLQKNCVQLK